MQSVGVPIEAAARVSDLWLHNLMHRLWATRQYAFTKQAPKSNVTLARAASASTTAAPPAGLGTPAHVCNWHLLQTPCEMSPAVFA